MSSKFTDSLLDWYQTHARSLPWRDQPEPYRVWVSEVMLQQTRVDTVIPYFNRWMEIFPTINSLAHASQLDVLAEWEGLGYYSRARNMHRTAQILVNDFAGQLPRHVDQLHQLPGIGQYTAGAIASIAFGLDQPVLDGNIRRVLARVFNLTEPAGSAAGEKILWKLAKEYLPTGRAGDYNQALMELGALVCTSRKPGCEICPLSSICEARSLGIQQDRPVKRAKPPQPHHIVSSAIILENHKVLIAQRPQEGLLGGMWEFPGGKVEHGEDLITGLEREICEELGIPIKVGPQFGVYKHAYTHFRVTLHAFICERNGEQPEKLYHDRIIWCPVYALHEYPMGKIDRQISVALQRTLESA